MWRKYRTTEEYVIVTSQKGEEKSLYNNIFKPYSHQLALFVSTAGHVHIKFIFLYIGDQHDGVTQINVCVCKQTI